MRQIKKILIVGGGPAGLMTALALSQHDLQITLIEKSKWPIDKVCGEGIMPVGVELLRKYGVESQISKKLSHPFTGITYYDQEIKAHGSFDSKTGLVVRRTELSQVLFEIVQKRKNIFLQSQTELVDLKFSKDSFRATIRHERIGNSFDLGEYDLVVACDGLRSKVRKIMGMEGKILRKQNRIGARVHYQVRPWSSQVEVFWGNGIECYVVPVSAESVEFVFGWNQDKLQIKSGRSDLLLSKLFGFFPVLYEKIKNAPKLSELEATGNFARQAKTPISDNIVLIGDANVFLDPITGEGLSLAFEQADILAKYLPKLHLQQEKIKFKSEILNLKNRYVRNTKVLLYLSEHHHLRRMVLKILAKYPRVFQHFLEVNMGSRKIFEISKIQHFHPISEKPFLNQQDC